MPILAAVGFRFSRRSPSFERTFPKRSASWTAWNSKWPIFYVLGMIESDGVTFYRAPTRQHTTNSEFNIDTLSALPKVEIISAYYDADPGMIQAAVDLGFKGL